jgi:thiamine-phosphate pyrophosphorylase
VIRYQITNGLAAADEARWLLTLREDVDFIQIRERDSGPRELARLTRRVLREIRGPRVLVNGRADVAIASGAAGVHLPGGSPPAALFRRISPDGFVITVACHSVEEVNAAAGADYTLLAPIFRPLSKPDERVPLGVDAIRQCRMPVIALGGITEENATMCIAAGAAGVAGITIFERR